MERMHTDRWIKTVVIVLSLDYNINRLQEISIFHSITHFDKSQQAWKQSRDASCLSHEPVSSVST